VAKNLQRKKDNVLKNSFINIFKQIKNLEYNQANISRRFRGLTRWLSFIVFETVKIGH